jgi:hypothetical protein
VQRRLFRLGPDIELGRVERTNRATWLAMCSNYPSRKSKSSTSDLTHQARGVRRGLTENLEEIFESRSGAETIVKQVVQRSSEQLIDYCINLLGIAMITMRDILWPVRQSGGGHNLIFVP